MNTPADSPSDPEPDEHRRFARYQQELAQVAPEAEIAVIRAILSDPDDVMADAALVGHLDHRAAQLLTEATFPDWAFRMSATIANRDFLTRRLNEWTLLRSIVLNTAWTTESVLAASNWFQYKATDLASTPAALTLLATHGRTRRIRAAAIRRLTQREHT
ncbi:hypothetical protein [Nocardia concava]|uniref:hypothetical protein n=1 Tax=Nocardia concava TaxID=257281 RepID=UPI0002DF27AA|nr:hypothetical protein [Nocardia concava]